MNGLWGVAIATAFVGGGVGLGLYGSQAWHRIQQTWITVRGDAQRSRPPLEALADDVRRLRIEMVQVPAGTPVARRQGLQLAYDDALLALCDTLEVPPSVRHDLTRHPLGPERDVARLLVEQELTARGLNVAPQ